MRILLATRFGPNLHLSKAALSLAGTCRMGASGKDSVCNAYGQTHDIGNLFISDGSQFTTGGAENPTLTIVTLAIRQAEYIAKQMTARSI